jgi:hypothetical protein
MRSIASHYSNLETRNGANGMSDMHGKASRVAESAAGAARMNPRLGNFNQEGRKVLTADPTCAEATAR